VELQYALAQIADIHHQINRSRQFRGFRSLTTLGTAGAAVIGGVWQALQIPDSANHPTSFILLWLRIAAGCMAVCAAEAFWRYRRADSALQQELAPLAVEQFLPPIFVAGVLTAVLWRFSPGSVWMLPGLWQIFFGLAHLAIRRLFPLPIFFVGVFYVLCGLANLNSNVPHFSPWCMALPFAVGQTMSAVILYWYLERHHAAS
jgi:hypothetical protein